MWGEMKHFEIFAAVATVAAAVSSASVQAQAQTPAPAKAPFDPAAQIKEACGLNPVLPAAEVTILRNLFRVSDRLATREVEEMITNRAKLLDRCLDEVTKRVDAQASQTTPDVVAAYKTAINKQRASAVGEIRAVFVSYGYRPSSAAPGPRYGFCRLHDNFDPPQFKDYLNNYYVSAVFIDRDPEAEVPDKDEFTPKTKAGQRVLGAMAQWIASRYKPATSRENQYCVFFLSANDAQKELDKEISDDAIQTGVQ